MGEWKLDKNKVKTQLRPDSRWQHLRVRTRFNTLSNSNIYGLLCIMFYVLQKLHRVDLFLMVIVQSRRISLKSVWSVPNKWPKFRILQPIHKKYYWIWYWLIFIMFQILDLAWAEYESLLELRYFLYLLSGIKSFAQSSAKSWFKRVVSCVIDPSLKDSRNPKSRPGSDFQNSFQH